MSKAIFVSLPPDQQKVLLSVGEEMEPWAKMRAIADDRLMNQVYEKAGVKVRQFNTAELEKWREVAAGSLWKEFAAKSEQSARYLKLATAVSG